MRTLTHTTVALLLAFVGTSLLGQQAAGARGIRPGMAGRVLRQQLQLTNEQVSQLKEIRRQQFQALRPQREQIRTAARALREMTAAANPDATAIGNQVLALKNLRNQLRDARKEWNQKALAVLTPEQAAKLKELIESRAARRTRALGLLDGAERPQRQ